MSCATGTSSCSVLMYNENLDILLFFGLQMQAIFYYNL